MYDWLSFAVQVKPLLEAGQATELADPNLGDDYDQDQLKRMVAVASRCIMRPAMWRPSMAEVPCINLLTEVNWLTCREMFSNDLVSVTLHVIFQVLHFLSNDDCLKEPEKWNIPEDEVNDMDDCTLFSESLSP
jgi:hypothetical protein